MEKFVIGKKVANYFRSGHRIHKCGPRHRDTDFHLIRNTQTRVSYKININEIRKVNIFRRVVTIDWFVLQLSYADTHPMFSSTDFPNFFRVVPSENAFNAPRLALLRHFNWTRVGTIYQNEPRYALVSFFIITYVLFQCYFNQCMVFNNLVI